MPTPPVTQPATAETTVARRWIKMRCPRLPPRLSGELFATTLSFGVLSIIKLVSSVILTRILYPEAYGIVLMLSSLMFTIEMLSDVGIMVSMIRSSRGDDPRFINTLWTIRLIRSVINFVIFFVCAPYVAAWYETPALTEALRAVSIFFIVAGLESMSFTLAVRHRRSRIVTYTELFSTAVTTVFVILYSQHSRDHFGMIYGMVLNRTISTVMSYGFSREHRHRLLINRDACRELFGFSKYVMPSSIITLISTQFDKVIFLKLFDLSLLGLYGLAGSVVGPIEGLVWKISRFVLFPRCAEYFRSDPATVRVRYYRENVRLFAAMSLLPALAGGSAELLVRLLYDSRYAYAAVIIQAFAVRAVVLSLASPMEDLLVASGRTHVQLIGNVMRVAWLIPAVLLGYHLFGFVGFIYFGVLEMLPALLYYSWLLRRMSLLDFRFEAAKLGAAVLLFGLAWWVSRKLLDSGLTLQHLRAVF